MSRLELSADEMTLPPGYVIPPRPGAPPGAFAVYRRLRAASGMRCLPPPSTPVIWPKAAPCAAAVKPALARRPLAARREDWTAEPPMPAVVYEPPIPLGGTAWPPRIERIIAVTAAHFGVGVLDIKGRSRRPLFVHPRQIAMYLAKTLSPRSLPEIAARLGGRDHTTVLHGVRKIAAQLRVDSRLRADLATLREMLSPEPAWMPGGVDLSAQNTSSAVMAQRREPKDSLDYFPTPRWATRALCEWLLTVDSALPASVVWEPACGEGHMAMSLSEYFGDVIASDVHEYGYGYARDFLWPDDIEPVDWVVTNPPFRLGAEFVARARGLIDRPGVAMLVRTAFLESADRYNGLFARDPPSDILQFVERVPMFRGRLDATGSTATAYCWLVWRFPPEPAALTRFHWIAPCRARLERAGDYPPPPQSGPMFD